MNIENLLYNDYIIVLKENNKIIFYNDYRGLVLSNKSKDHIIKIDNETYKVNKENIFINNKLYSLEIYINLTKDLNYYNNLNIDALTKLPNRKLINEKLEEIEKNNNDYTLIMCDIDDFKKVNDTYGHLEGDKVLKNVSNVLKKYLFKKAFVGRYGGEEFLIIFENVTDEYIKELLDKIRKEVYQKENISMTFGIAKKELNKVNDVLSNADKALYKGKKLGKNCIINYKV